MDLFTATLQARPLLHSNSVKVFPKDVKLIPQRWSSRDIGGPESASIKASGSEEGLRHLLSWLGDRAEIHNSAGTLVWWGVVTEIEVAIGGVSVTWTLDGVYNSVRVQYSERQADGTTLSKQTTAASDAGSQERYGQRELLYSMEDIGTLAEAEALRDRLLANVKYPAPVIRTRTQTSAAEATLVCRGYWDLLDEQYYTNTKGYIEHTYRTGQRYLGAAYVVYTISFGTYADPSGGKDDIKDTNNGLGGLAEGQIFTISGASVAGNNGLWTVQTPGATNIETVENGQQDEAAGALICVTLGDQGWIAGLGQSFTLPLGENWDARKVMLRVQKVGHPSDDLDLSISTGAYPGEGSIIAVTSVPASAVPTQMGWVEWTLPEGTILYGGTTYWIAMARAGTASIVDYYIFDIDEDATYTDGSGMYYAGGSYTTLGETFDVPFRVIAKADTTEVLKSVVTAGEPDIDLALILVDGGSGQEVEIYSDIDRSRREYATQLLGMGTAAGERLLLTVNPNRTATIYTPPAPSTTNLYMGTDGIIRYSGKSFYEPGQLIVGRWVDINKLPVLPGVNRQAVYIERAEFNAVSGTLTLQSEGAIDPYQAVRLSRG